MELKRTSQTMNLNNITGALLLILGLAVMVASLSLLGFQFRGLLDNSPMDFFGSYVGLGLVSLRFVQSIVFHDGVVFSFASEILVLFSAIAAILAGLAQLQNRAAKTIASERPRTSQPVKGDQ